MGKSYGASGFLSAIPGVGPGLDSVNRSINPLAAALFPADQPKLKTPTIPPPPKPPEITAEADLGDPVQRKRKQADYLRTYGSNGTLLSNSARLGG